MKIALFSHCAIDTIMIGDSKYEQIGGAACYGGITARQFKFDVDLVTKFGSDFPYKQYLTDNKLNFENAQSEKGTTRFSINIEGADRTLKLENQCEPIEYAKINADGFLVSPIFHEISSETLKEIKKDSNFLLIDPQGFLRRTDSEKNVVLEDTDIDLSQVSVIKVNPEEALHLTGSSTEESLKILQKRGVEHAILTNKTEVSMLVNDQIYSITLPNKKIYDTTGVGDIFCSAFCCTMLKEKDFVWALCFAGGAAQAALESKDVGLLKIPKKGAVENNASYFYNLMKFRSI
ncbi:MAG: ribokinase [Nitrosopumilaceae archaeon]|uniref:Ribokinase n=3 Tax=Candidatus Nitrosomaritimum aestuariumsis TaxID=3342354 RepID=A0AC60W6J3_9ARCH|nr:ribokinase [Nitrosopumilaceae archaeon]MBA4462708.1 ribokinase [Nitrosopumilaceae archaeon]